MSVKNPILAFLALAILLPLQADEYLKNGDFSNGSTHWDGEARNIADQKPDQDIPSSPPGADTPSSGADVPKQGIVIKLKSIAWTKTTQEFTTKSGNLTLSVTYQFSPDTVFSDNPEDYKNVSHHIGFDHWVPFDCMVGNWMVLVSDFSKQKIWLFKVRPSKGAPNAPPTYSGEVHCDLGDKAICLAFPQGKGQVYVTMVSVKD